VDHGFGFDNRVNSGPVHGVALVQADGRGDLRQPGGTNRGDTGDSYPGSSGNTALCRTTSPAATDNQGGFAWFCLNSITQMSPGGRVSFSYVSFHSVFAADHAGARISVNGSSVPRLERFFLPGTSTELSIDSLQTDATGRTRFGFLAWSDGGARTHIVTARDTPDTVTAQVAVEHRLRMVVEGAPATAILSNVSGDVVGGLFLAEGSLVSLRPDPQPSAVFAGWTGDTTATRDTLTLTLRHPFDLRANFVAFQEIALNNVADAILGAQGLPGEDVLYLDAAGNRNGRYDLGDFLAAADRAGSNASIETIAGGRR